MKIPLHLIGGSLGVGKTTAIRRFVAESAEYVAVIVNDFGETSYDAGLIEESGGGTLRVENVPGGCLCCTSAAQLLPALESICSRPEVERILIEPSGVAMLDSLLKMLDAAAPTCGFEIASVIVLFDPDHSRPGALKRVPYWKHLVDRADIVVANRCDLASPQAVDSFCECLNAWVPAKLQVVTTSQGELPAALFALRALGERSGGEPHHHAELPPAGTFRSDDIFQLDQLTGLLHRIAAETARFKGVFQTEQGWVRLEVAVGNVVQKPVEAAEESSADWIGAPDLTAPLQACRSPKTI
jgi:G3E family GTPase